MINVHVRTYCPTITSLAKNTSFCLEQVMAAETHQAADVVIVGGGTAGLVLASRLSEDPTLHVLVLEAGQDLPQLPRPLVEAVLTPAANRQLWKTPVDWNLKTVPQEGLGGREIVIPQGKMLGGSTGLNGLSFTASTKAVVDGWAEIGNPGWDWSAFSQSLAKAYTVAKAPASSTAEHTSITGAGTNQGPLRVAYADALCAGDLDGWPKVWANTIESLGFPGAQDTLSLDQKSGGLIIPDTVDPEAGIRSYAANAYLSPDVRSRANLTVLTGVDVHKVVLQKPADSPLAVATGVEFTDGTTPGAIKTVTARREVIVSAGVFGSPKLLELSGIGDATRLPDGVVVIVDNPGVGENLQNHPMVTVSFEVTDDAPPTKDPFVRAALRKDPQVLGAAMAEYASHRKGIFASSGVTSAAQLPLPPGLHVDGDPSLLGLSLTGGSRFAQEHERFVKSMMQSSSSSSEEATGYYIFGPAYAAFNPDGTSALPPFLDGSEDNYITVVCLLAHPLSRGSVHVVGTGHDQKLAIDPAYLTHPLDLEVMARHVQFVEHTLAATEPLVKSLKSQGKRAVGAPEAGALKDLSVVKK